jgi:phage gp36-like protein
MSYCTPTDLEARLSARKLIQCLDEERLATGVSTLGDAVGANPAIGVRLNAIIDDASSDCDMHLRTRYSVPMSPVPDSIRKCAIDLALYYAHSFRASEFAMPDAIKDRRDSAMDALESISQAGLEIGTNAPPPAGTRPTARVSQRASRWSSCDDNEGW